MPASSQLQRGTALAARMPVKATTLPQTTRCGYVKSKTPAPATTEAGYGVVLGRPEDLEGDQNCA